MSDIETKYLGLLRTLESFYMERENPSPTKILQYSKKEILPKTETQVTNFSASQNYNLLLSINDNLISEKELLNWHSQISQYSNILSGAYRTCNVRVGYHICPDHKKVPKLMKDFLDEVTHLWSFDLISPSIHIRLNALSFIEGEFCKIHPFQDYNGRIIRLLMAKCALRAGLPKFIDLIGLYLENPRHYYFPLDRYDSGDKTQMIKMWNYRIGNLINEKSYLEIESLWKDNSTHFKTFKVPKKETLEKIKIYDSLDYSFVDLAEVHFDEALMYGQYPRTCPVVSGHRATTYTWDWNKWVQEIKSRKLPNKNYIRRIIKNVNL